MSRPHRIVFLQPIASLIAAADQPKVTDGRNGFRIHLHDQ